MQVFLKKALQWVRPGLAASVKVRKHALRQRSCIGVLAYLLLLPSTHTWAAESTTPKTAEQPGVHITPQVLDPRLRQRLLKPGQVQLPSQQSKPPADQGQSPPPAQPPAAAEPLSIPHNQTTGQLEMIGSPNPPAALAPFTPIVMTTGGLEMIGSAEVPPPSGGSFAPRTINTGPLEMIGR